MSKCHVRIDYASQKGSEHPWLHEGRAERLATLFRDAGYGVKITHDRHANITANDDDAVIIAQGASAAQVLKLLVEGGGFKRCYVKCGRYSTAISESQVLIRLGRR